MINKVSVPPEVLRQVRLIELRTRRLVNSLFAGEYRSIFKGHGMEFAEVREYMPGDEVRSIDWNVSARMGKPFVKRYIEERELTVMLAVDLSGSSQFGTVSRFKAEMATELAAVLTTPDLPATGLARHLDGWQRSGIVSIPAAVGEDFAHWLQLEQRSSADFQTIVLEQPSVPDNRAC